MAQRDRPASRAGLPAARFVGRRSDSRCSLDQSPPPLRSRRAFVASFRLLLQDRLDGPASLGVKSEGALGAPAWMAVGDTCLKRFSDLHGISLARKHAIDLGIRPWRSMLRA